MLDLELYEAVSNDEAILVVELLQNRSSEQVAQATSWACGAGSAQTTLAILQNFSCEKNFSAREKFSCMHSAMSSHNNTLDVLKLLIGFGFSPLEECDFGANLLFFCKGVPYNVFEYLLEAGADPRAKSTGGATPLMSAAKSGRTDLVKLLVQHGAEINVQDEEGNSALLYAIRRGRSDTAINLIRLGANIFHENNSCLTPLRAALRIKNRCLLEEMFLHGIRLTDMASDNMTGLEWVKSQSMQDVLDWLSDFAPKTC